jgi:hypothetical protein
MVPSISLQSMVVKHVIASPNPTGTPWQNNLQMFHNLLPWFDLPSYSINVDRGAHILFNNNANAAALLSAAPPFGNKWLHP